MAKDIPLARGKPVPLSGARTGGAMHSLHRSLVESVVQRETSTQAHITRAQREGNHKKVIAREDTHEVDTVVVPDVVVVEVQSRRQWWSTASHTAPARMSATWRAAGARPVTPPTASTEGEGDADQAGGLHRGCASA